MVRHGLAFAVMVSAILSTLASGESPHVSPATPPSVDYRIFDPANSWRETSTVVEGQTYAYDASWTRDDADANVNLTFRWDFGDGTVLGPGKGGAPDGLLNVTHTYARYGQYRFNITAIDRDNEVAGILRTIVVQVNITARPDLSQIAGTLRIVPPSPEEGATVTFSVNFTNAKGRANATQLNVLLTMVVSGKDTNQTISGVDWRKPDGSPLTVLEAGQNGTVRFTWPASGIGNKSLTVKVWDSNEPDSLMGGNSQTTTILVRRSFRNILLMSGMAVAITTLGSIVALLAGLRRLDRRRGRH